MNCLLNCSNNNLLDYTEFEVAFQSLKLSLAQNKVDFFSNGRLKPFSIPCLCVFATNILRGGRFVR